jgi:tRNA-dihydrouridine synthase 1
MFDSLKGFFSTLTCKKKTTLKTKKPEKLTGYDFYRSIGSPKYLCAPMVDQSELSFRLLTRRYGCQLAYTPMFHSR